MLLQQLILNVPMWSIGDAFFPAHFVLVLNNASNLNVGKRERLLQNLYAFSFNQGAVEQLAGKGHDCAIGVDGAGLHVRDMRVLVVVRNLHVGVFLALLGKNLDAAVAVLVMLVVVVVLLAVEDHRSHPRLAGIGGHFELVRTNWQPVIAGEDSGWHGGYKQKGREKSKRQ